MRDGGSTPAGSSRAQRLDPFALPVRFPANDAGADERVRIVELHRERVVMRRAVRGIPMAVSVPVSAFRGIAIRVVKRDDGISATIAVVLEHRDAGLSTELFASDDGDEILTEWQTWGRVLGLPLLVAERDGELHEPFQRLGAVRIGAVAPRRRRRTVIRRRRPSILMRRRPGRMPESPTVHRDEREIIARN
jgi:Family of unknown function (DUF6101)